MPDAVKLSACLCTNDYLLDREINNHDNHSKLQKDPWESYYQLPVNGHTLEQVEVNIPRAIQIPWSIHMSNITKKAILTIGFLRRILQHFSKLCRQITHISLARSVLEYSATKLEKGNRTSRKGTK